MLSFTARQKRNIRLPWEKNKNVFAFPMVSAVLQLCPCTVFSMEYVSKKRDKLVQNVYEEDI